MLVSSSSPSISIAAQPERDSVGTKAETGRLKVDRRGREDRLRLLFFFETPRQRRRGRQEEGGAFKMNAFMKKKRERQPVAPFSFCFTASMLPKHKHCQKKGGFLSPFSFCLRGGDGDCYNNIAFRQKKKNLYGDSFPNVRWQFCPTVTAIANLVALR